MDLRRRRAADRGDRMEPGVRFARDGAVYITLPTGERERLQGVEAAMRGG